MVAANLIIADARVNQMTKQNVDPIMMSKIMVLETDLRLAKERESKNLQDKILWSEIASEIEIKLEKAKSNIS